jgi:phytoene dehydrogenase-like protein
VSTYDAVVVGAGHNGLVSAAYLARAGLRVLVLERQQRVGGAAVSVPLFNGHQARISRYAQLVSMLPEQILSDLDVAITLAPRPLATYAPALRDRRATALVVERPEGKATRNSFIHVSGSQRDYDAWCTFYLEVATLARTLTPTLLEPLPIEKSVASRVDPATWRELTQTPLGEMIERRFGDDTIRGVVASDALRGHAGALNDGDLIANRAFLYAMLGASPGESRVPVGGMGALSDALAASAMRAGAEIRTSSGVRTITAGADSADVIWDEPGGSYQVTTRFVLANVAPCVLHILQGEPDDPATKPQGSGVVVNLLLDRLPRLHTGLDPAIAFSGNLHINTEYSWLAAAHEAAMAGRVPQVVPTVATCPSLVDPTVLGDAPRGQQVLSLRTFHTPATLFTGDETRVKAEILARVLEGLQAHLSEAIEPLIARDSFGKPCIDTVTPDDVEYDLAMPGGHDHHGDLDWPWASNRARLDTPAQQWGVQTEHDPVLLCGAGARRGGGISGIGGHNAAMAVLASR